jgi:hypothetical protein
VKARTLRAGTYKLRFSAKGLKAGSYTVTITYTSSGKTGHYRLAARFI